MTPTTTRARARRRRAREDATSPDDATCAMTENRRTNARDVPFVRVPFRYAARTATGFVKTAANAVGLGFVLGRVVDATRAEERCVPFLVHGGEALASELIEKCPSLFGAYVPPSWCLNPHAQTLIGYGRMLTLFLKYDEAARAVRGRRASRAGLARQREVQARERRRERRARSRCAG